MLIGPTAVHPGGQSNGAEGYADLLNSKTMTVPSLTCAAAVVCPFRGYNHFYISHMSLQTCYTLSTEPTYRWVLKSNSPGFGSRLAFYQQIISTVEFWGEEE